MFDKKVVAPPIRRPMESAYIYVDENGNRVGPFKKEVIDQLRIDGIITLSTKMAESREMKFHPYSEWMSGHKLAIYPINNVEISGVKYRSGSKIFILTFLTLGLYSVYLSARWAGDLQKISKIGRLSFLSVIMLSVITLTFFTVIYLISLSISISKTSIINIKNGSNQNLVPTVIICMALSFICLLFAGLIIPIIISLLFSAVYLNAIQSELNLYSSQGN